MAGELTAVAFADLGGLGSRESAPARYVWAVPSLMPLALPWLVVLGLLMLKANRSAGAWWVWLPLIWVVGSGWWLGSLLDSLGPIDTESVSEPVRAVGFGLAALWLLGFWLRERHRVVVFLAMLVILGGVSLLVLALGRAWNADAMEMMFLLPIVGFWILVYALALSLAGRLCARRYGRWRFALWLLAWVAVSWTAVVVAFLPAPLLAGEGVAWVWLGMIIGSATVLSYLTLLPFLILSFANPLFGERLRNLLRMSSVAPDQAAPSASFAPPGVPESSGDSTLPPHATA